jgi:hypothetical protein
MIELLFKILVVAALLKPIFTEYSADYQGNGTYYYLYYDVMTEEEIDDSSASIYNDIMSGVAPTTNPYSLIKNKTLYNAKARPTGVRNLNNNIDNKTGALIIYTKFSLKQLIQIDERNQIMVTSFFLMISWNDPRLSWNPLNYSNTTTLTTYYANC